MGIYEKHLVIEKGDPYAIDMAGAPVLKRVLSLKKDGIAISTCMKRCLLSNIYLPNDVGSSFLNRIRTCYS